MATAMALSAPADFGLFEPKLYVKNLPGDIEEDELRKVFGLYGNIVDMFINRPQDFRDERSAFIRFEDAKACAAAMLVLADMYKFREDSQDPIAIMPARPRDDSKGGKGQKGGAWNPAWGANNWNQQRGAEAGGFGQNSVTGGSISGSPPPPPGGAPGQGRVGGFNADCKLWVGNLPSDFTPESLTTTFSVYGEVAEVNILPSKSKSGQLCAFVNFASTAGADACMEVMRRGFELRSGEGDLKVERPSERKGGCGGCGGGGCGVGCVGGSGGKGWGKDSCQGGGCPAGGCQQGSIQQGGFQHQQPGNYCLGAAGCSSSGQMQSGFAQEGCVAGSIQQSSFQQQGNYAQQQGNYCQGGCGAQQGCSGFGQQQAGFGQQGCGAGPQQGCGCQPQPMGGYGEQSRATRAYRPY